MRDKRPFLVALLIVIIEHQLRGKSRILLVSSPQHTLMLCQSATAATVDAAKLSPIIVSSRASLGCFH